MDHNSSDLPRSFKNLETLWLLHCAAQWPRAVGAHEGELMTLDTVISGCVTYVLESGCDLDERRVAILKDCLADLEDLLPELEDEARDYFQRVQGLGRLLLGGTSP